VPERDVTPEVGAHQAVGALLRGGPDERQEVTWPGGDTVHVPLRAVPDGAGCEIVFTVRRLPGMTDDDLARDAGLVAAALATLKALLESGPPS